MSASNQVHLSPESSLGADVGLGGGSPHEAFPRWARNPPFHWSAGSLSPKWVSHSPQPPSTPQLLMRKKKVIICRKGTSGASGQNAVGAAGEEMRSKTWSRNGWLQEGVGPGKVPALWNWHLLFGPQPEYAGQRFGTLPSQGGRKTPCHRVPTACPGTRPGI